jgi:hypothetical protein
LSRFIIFREELSTPEDALHFKSRVLRMETFADTRAMVVMWILTNKKCIVVQL